MNNPIDRPILFEYFESTAGVLQAEYERSKQQNAAANLGRNREVFSIEFLKKVLPLKFSVRSGEIWDSSKNKTGQLDIIILRDDAPVLNIGSDDVYIAEGTFAVIEIKSNLTRTKLDEAGDSLTKVSNLNINVGAVISSGATIDRPLRIVFAYEGANWDTLLDEINNKGWFDLFDLICILNKGVLIKKGRLINWEGNGEFSIINSKAASLGFLYFYLISYGTSFLGRNLILNPYFEPLSLWNE